MRKTDARMRRGGVTMSKEKARKNGSGLRAYIVTVLAIGVLEAVAALFIIGWRAGLSVGIGASIAAANLVLLGHLVRAFLDPTRLRRRWVGLSVLKLAVLACAMYLPVKTGLAQVLPLMIGFGALPVGIVVAQLFAVDADQGES
jgi:hypothetical protein